MTSPADKVIKKLYALDDRRIDLCNLKVLYGFIEDGLGEKFDLLRSCAACGAACDYYELAARQLARAGYTLQKAEKEFSYLFKLIKRPRAARRYLPAHSAADATIGAT